MSRSIESHFDYYFMSPLRPEAGLDMLQTVNFGELEVQKKTAVWELMWGGWGRTNY